MKKIILSLFLVVSLPFLLFSQSERMQKQSFRSPQISNGHRGDLLQSTQSRPSIGEYEQKQSARRQNYVSIDNNRPGRYYVPYSYWGTGWGWNNWGAPMFGWDYWTPMYYWNDWGYRQPARIYVYDNGKRDTIRGKKPIMSVGIQTSDIQTGGFFTIGNKHYFIVEFQTNNKKDQSTFYRDITMSDVRGWNDMKMADITKLNTTYLGIGKRFKRSGIHLSLGFNTENSNYQYFDELYVLSNNGRYSFPNYRTRFTSLKLGALHDAKIVTFKGDYDLTNRRVIIGAGVNF